MNLHLTLLDITGICLAGLAMVVASIAIGCFANNMSLRDLAKKVLVFLAKKKIITMPKKKLYVVALQVRLDGIIIKQMPVEVWAYKRRHAKFEITKRLTFSTGTTAQRADLIKHSKKAK
jgi:hypothetical protein